MGARLVVVDRRFLSYTVDVGSGTRVDGAGVGARFVVVDRRFLSYTVEVVSGGVAMDMSEPQQGEVPGAEQRYGLTRRRLLKVGAAGLGAAWASPVILSFDTRAAAASVPPVPPPPPPAPCPTPLGAFNPLPWNNPANVGTNNCYNYACDTLTGTFAQPGRGGGMIYTSLSIHAVKNAALRDNVPAGGGFVLSTKNMCCPQVPAPGAQKVVLVVRPAIPATPTTPALGADFHWLRQDMNGTWSHKPGGTPATNLDNAGAIITDPETANLGHYATAGAPRFVYFCVNKARIRIA